MFGTAVSVTPPAYTSSMSCPDHAAKRARARELRVAGWSRSQIMRELGIRNKRSLNRWIGDLPAPDWTRRPRAKDDLRARAIDLRRQGKTYAEIRESLAVSKSSLSLWLRDLYLTDDQKAVLESKKSTAPQRRGATNRARREAARSVSRAHAAQEIGWISERQLFLAGAILYWAEGAKAKPWRPTQCVSSINSDPGLVLMFLRWLDLIGVESDRLTFRLSIHESADLDAAESYWREILREFQPHPRFMRPQVKRHLPRTNRRNTGDGYRGCLIIRVSRSTELYRRIEGWVHGIVTSLGRGVTAARRPLEPSGLGSNPGAPATFQSTLFEPSPAYEWQRAG